MLDADVRVVDLGGENMSRLFGLLSGALPGGETGVLVIVHSGYRVLRAIDIDRREPVHIEFSGTTRLDAVAARYGYRHVLALDETAGARIIGHAQRLIHYRDDYLKQWYAFAEGLSREWRRTVFTWPWSPRRLPLVPYPIITGALRLLMPRDCICLLAVTEDDRAWASLAFGWRDGDVRLLTSLESVGMDEADLADNGLPTACRALEEEFGAVTRGAAIELVALQRVLRSPHPAASLIRAHVTGELRLRRFPIRWMLFWLALLTARAGVSRR